MNDNSLLVFHTMSKKDLNIVNIRSYLASNVDVLLEYISTKRKSQLNNSHDLFDIGMLDSETSHIPWHTTYNKRNTLDILLQEKESLGLYVSGNPLKYFIDIQEWVQTYTYLEHVHIILVDKIKKIFTKSGNMMFALQISTTTGPMEGIIFPKNAMKFSPYLEEKKIFFIYGKESTRKRNRTKTDDDGETQEYDELPKLLLDSISPFEEGVLSLLEKLEKHPDLTTNKREVLSFVDWGEILLKPHKFNTKDIPSKHPKPQESPTATNTSHTITQLRFPISSPKEVLSACKKCLRKESSGNDVCVNISIETSAGWKKAKGTFYIDHTSFQEFSSYSS